MRWMVRVAVALTFFSVGLLAGCCGDLGIAYEGGTYTGIEYDRIHNGTLIAEDDRVELTFSDAGTVWSVTWVVPEGQSTSGTRP